MGTGRRPVPNDPDYIPTDLATSGGRDHLAARLESEIDRLDVVIHNAGILGPAGTNLDDYPEEAWRSVLEVNVTAVQLLHRRLVPLLSRSDRPRVIVTSSGVGRAARAGWGAYAVSKYALEGWAEMLADEWRGRGCVYSVNPGATATTMRAAAVPDEDPATLPTPDDVAAAYLRLAHPDCPEPTGSRIDARDWIGRDPWFGLQHPGRPGIVSSHDDQGMHR